MTSDRTCRALFAALLFVAAALPARAQVYEKILLPVVVEEPLAGAFGSSWVTDIRILNRGPEAVGVFGITPTCPFECNDPAVLNPGVTFRPKIFFAGGGLQGVFLHAPTGFASQLSFALRFRDLSRQSQTWGTELPVVREGMFRPDKVSLIDVPLTFGFRHVLRIYELDATERQALVRVRMYRIAPDNQEPNGALDLLLGESTIALQFPSPRIPDAHPGYAAVSDPSTIAPLGNATRVRLEIEPVTPGLRLWAFVTVVNNETQHATVITPQ
ncbi:MAG TPA: hypothetical protein VFW15_11635 [Thermoanaerobaculia bacterium]|nr:hypothetical protein [Thermoanaerobaculia bacterium]